MLSLAGERFDRRLAETGASLRVQIAQSEAALRAEMGQMEVRIVREIANLSRRPDQRDRKRDAAT